MNYLTFSDFALEVWISIETIWLKLNILPHRIVKLAHLALILPVRTFVLCSSNLLVFLGSIYCKQYGPRSDCSQWEESDQGS